MSSRFIAASARPRKWLPVVLLVAAASAPEAIAGSQLSPVSFRIVGLEVKEGSGVLRMFVEERIQPGAGSRAFNPAACATERATFRRMGGNTSRPVFDLALGARGRSKTQQQAMLNAIYAAYATDRMIQISVRDDMCTPTLNTPHVSGVEVLE